MFDPVQYAADVAALHELAARVAAVDVAGISGEQAADALAEVHSAERQLQLSSVTLIERVDRSGVAQANGSRSTVAYLQNALGETPEWASARVKLGRALADKMPTVRAAWAAGGIGMTQACIIRDALEDLKGELASDVELTLGKAAPVISIADLKEFAKLIRQQAAPEEAAEKARRDYERQHVTLSKTLNGMYDLRGLLDAEHGSILKQALDAFTRKRLRSADPTLGPLDRMPAAFHRAQALIEMARQAVSHGENCDGPGGAARATIIVTIDRESLTHGYGSGEIEGHTIVAASAVRRLACESDLITKIIGSDGAMLDFGRRTRTIPASLRAHLVSRDGGCIIEGCDAPASWCEAHHLTHWINGGKTDPFNTALFCTFHHHVIHDEGWVALGDAEGDLSFIVPGDPVPRRTQRKGIIARAPALLRR